MQERKTFKRGGIFLNYEILQLIGRGGFADVYYVRNTKDQKRYALKVETIGEGKRTIANEQMVMQEIQGSGLFPRYIDSGQTKNYRFLVMECLGPSLTTVRKLRSGNKFSLSTTLIVAVETLRCIREFHNCGFIHRDIKPANFLIRPSRSKPLALIDYGLSRRYIDPETNEHVQPRARVGFAGTAKYASLNAHECKELSRRDDLISWWFSIVEIYNGKLPWGTETDKNVIYNSKLNLDVNTLNLPKELTDILDLILEYKFEDKPNYALITSFLIECMNNNSCFFDEDFDWEELNQREKENVSVISFDPPKNEMPTIPTDLVPAVKPKKEDEESKNHEKPEKKKKKCFIC